MFKAALENEHVRYEGEGDEARNKHRPNLVVAVVDDEHDRPRSVCHLWSRRGKATPPPVGEEGGGSGTMAATKQRETRKEMRGHRKNHE